MNNRCPNCFGKHSITRNKYIDGKKWRIKMCLDCEFVLKAHKVKEN